MSKNIGAGPLPPFLLTRVTKRVTASHRFVTLGLDVNPQIPTSNSQSIFKPQNPHDAGVTKFLQLSDNWLRARGKVET
jgi:hypothetical protein